MIISFTKRSQYFTQVIFIFIPPWIITVAQDKGTVSYFITVVYHIYESTVPVELYCSILRTYVLLE